MYNDFKDFTNEKYDEFKATNPSEEEEIEWFYDCLKGLLLWSDTIAGDLRDSVKSGYWKHPINRLKDGLYQLQKLLHYFDQMKDMTPEQRKRISNLIN